jgi:hypothetical protein
MMVSKMVLTMILVLPVASIRVLMVTAYPLKLVLVKLVTPLTAKTILHATQFVTLRV